jgi:flagellar biosynthesis/type III secretory pathway protein FliH
LQTPEGFVSLASILRRAQDDEVLPQPRHGDPSIPQGDTNDNDVVVVDDAPSNEELEMLREVRLFHARVIEAVEAAIETLVEDIAAEVLGRELLLAPADIERIVDRALQRFASEEPLRVRVHPDDASRLTCALPVIADGRLRAGDAMLELRDGYVDASLGVRVQALLRAVTAA